MKKLSETKIQALDRAADYLIEALDKGAQGTAKILDPRDGFIDEDKLKAAHVALQFTERSITTLRELIQLRREYGQ